jgi:chlorite dismutase
MVPSRLFTFVGRQGGMWRVEAIRAVAGEGLPLVSSVDVVPGSPAEPLPGASWSLRGIVSNERYVTHAEKASLVSQSPPLRRPEATLAALIPIRKTAAWWTMTQDARRDIFEEQSKHIAIGSRYLPGVARRLHHCRDLGENEPFDFLTWFEYAPSDAGAFEELVAALRRSPEWAYVEREVDVRLRRDEEGAPALR